MTPGSGGSKMGLIDGDEVPVQLDAKADVIKKLKPLNAWIPTSEQLPDYDLWVDIKLPSDAILEARIVENEFNEAVWLSRSGHTAHLLDYTAEELKRHQLLTQATMPTPVAWRHKVETQK